MKMPSSIIKSQWIGVAWWAFCSAALSLGVSAGLEPSFGVVIGYVAIPILLALLAWAIAGILRLSLIGFMPGDSYQAYLTTAGPWAHKGMVAQLGLMFGWLIMIAAMVVAALAGVGLSYCVYALVYLVLARMFINLIAGILINVGIVRGRARAS